jgi:uncharacterized RDD family membrane protein YckC
MSTAELDLSRIPASKLPIQATGKPFAIRAVAVLIDWAFVAATHYVLSFVLGIVVYTAFALSGRTIEFGLETGILPFLIGIVLNILYYSLFEWIFGATPAKFILRMRVITDTGKRLDLGTSIWRACLRYVDSILLGIPALITMKPPLYQRMGDRATHTIVVGSTDPFILEPRSGGWFLAAVAAWLAAATIPMLVLIVAAVR